MIEMIKEAIREGKVIGVAHHRKGHHPTVRMLEIYALGYTSKGNLAIRAKQIAGSGITLFPVNVALFLISNMSGPFFTGQEYTVPSSMNQDKGLHNIQAYAKPKSLGNRLKSATVEKKFVKKGNKLRGKAIKKAGKYTRR